MPNLWNYSFNGLPTNRSLLTTTDTQDLIAIYGKVEFSSAIILAILAPITVFTNGLFLLALYQDSLKCFRKTPTTFFIAGLSLADFVTGLFVEPSFALHYFLQYYQYSSNVLRVTRLMYVIGGTLSTIAISTSFVIVLAMSLSQYIAIRYPHRYKKIITTSRVVRLLGLSGLYFLGFSMLQFTGISRRMFLLIDVILHPTLISCLLIVVLILIRRAFKERVSKPARRRTFTSTIRFQHKDLMSVSKPPPRQSKQTIILKGNNNRNVSVAIELNAVERKASSEDSGDTANQYNEGLNTCELFQDIESTCREIKRKDKQEKMLELAADKGEELYESDKDMENEIQPNKDKNIKESRPPLQSLKRMKRSLYRKTTRKAPVEKQFAIMSFYLAAILLLSSVSHTAVFYVFLLKTPETITEDVYVNIALRVTDLMLFVKVFLDAFIYVWRLPAYRRSLILTILCGRIQLASDP